MKAHRCGQFTSDGKGSYKAASLDDLGHLLVGLRRVCHTSRCRMSQHSESLSTQLTEPMSSPNILSAYNPPKDRALPEQRASGRTNKRKRQFSTLMAEDEPDEMHPSKLDVGKHPRSVDDRDRRYWTVEKNWRLVKLRSSGLRWESLQLYFPGQSRADLAVEYDRVIHTYNEDMMNQCAHVY